MPSILDGPVDQLRTSANRPHEVLERVAQQHSGGRPGNSQRYHAGRSAFASTDSSPITRGDVIDSRLGRARATHSPGSDAPDGHADDSAVAIRR